MSHEATIGQREPMSLWRSWWCAMGAIAIGFAGCARSPQAFKTPEAAVRSFVTALRSGDDAQIEEVLGSEARDLLSSADEIADRNARDEFIAQYDQHHALAQTSEGVLTLEVGPTQWPCPIPLVEGENGWYFDTEAGKDELLSRRIGRNELSAMQVCLAIADAQREYAAADCGGGGLREYAQQFRSDPGKKNGLYWPSKPGEPGSPLGELVAAATAKGYFSEGAETPQTPRPYYGYYYRILTAQGPAAPGGALGYLAKGHMIGGFAIVAWPAEYGNSGLKTFMVSHHGTLYQKDLGDDTASLAREMKRFDPDPSWEPCGSLSQ